MASYLRSLNLVNGVEQVDTQIEVNAGDVSGVIYLRINGGNTTNRLYIGNDIDGTAGQIEMYSTSDKVLQIKLSPNSTQNLDLDLENTKATLEDGDILVYNTANNTFKVDNISDVIVKNNKSFKNVFLLGGM